FQTPLTVIRTGLELLRSGDSIKNEEDLKSIDSMIGQQERITRLVDDLLFLVRLDIDPLTVGQESFSVSALCGEVVSDVKNLPNCGGIALDVSVPEDIGSAEGRYDDIRRALFNLMENSVKYVSSFRKDGGRINLSAADTGQEFEIIVDDNGPGIPEGNETIIFERFRRGDHARARNGKGPGGYGLGLSISRRIAERHGGKLELAESKLGGASFKLTLPKA
ncbi:MAG: HAMP domain-containing sensor histidine kinase, partial [Synergistaceae bacterium]